MVNSSDLEIFLLALMSILPTSFCCVSEATLGPVDRSELKSCYFGSVGHSMEQAGNFSELDMGIACLDVYEDEYCHEPCTFCFVKYSQGSASDDPIQWTFGCDAEMQSDEEILEATGGHICQVTTSNEATGSLDIECHCSSEYCNSESFALEKLLSLKQGNAGS